MTLPYSLSWPVDEDGYDLTCVKGEWIVRRRGGRLNDYEPMREEGLWRRFADQCVDSDEVDSHQGILEFVRNFGLLAAQSPPTGLALLSQPSWNPKEPRADYGCVFRAKSAADSGMKSASDSDLISAIPI